MPKQVKRDLGKRPIPSMAQGAGEMVVGRRATRGFCKKEREDLMSSSDYRMFLDWAKEFNKRYKNAEEKFERFKLWLSSKAWVDARNALEPLGQSPWGLTFFSDLMPHEKWQFHGQSMTADPYNGNLRTPEFYESKLGKEVVEEEAAFDKWVAQYNKRYVKPHERKERFAFYFENKKIIETFKKENPGSCLNYTDDLDSKLDQPFGRRYLVSLLEGSAPRNEDNKGCPSPRNQGNQGNEGCFAQLRGGFIVTF